MVEHEPGLRVPALQLGRRLPAHVAEHVARAGRLDDRDVGSIHQLVQGSGHLGIAGVGEDSAVDLDSIAVAATGALADLARLLLLAPPRPRSLRTPFAHLT